MVLADQSRSMSVPDAVGNKTRWEALRLALTDAAPALAKLQRDFELKAYTFDADVHEAGVERGQDRAARQARGTANGHRRGARRRVAPRGGQAAVGRGAAERRRPAGLAPRDLPPQTAAARLQHLGYPLFTFPSASRAAWARPTTWPSRTLWSIPACSSRTS